MIRLAIFSVFTVVIAGPRQPYPKWANESTFGQYQSVWKTLNQSHEALYYLTHTTYENDTLSWGKKFQCVVVKEVNRSADNLLTSQFAFKNASESSPEKIYTVVENITAVFRYDYKKSPNAIRYLVEENKYYIDPLIFSDTSCDIFQVPYANGDKGGLELWVHEDNVDSIPKHCSFLLELLKEENDIVYEKYTKKDCEEVTKKMKSKEKDYV